jgi:signal transduction histidine kinase
MIRSNKNLLQMVNTLLEVYRHDAGNKTLTFAPLDLRGLAEEVVQELMPLMQAQNLSFFLEPVSGDNTKMLVLGDRLELRRVLTNLIGNAIKFTDKGSITVRLSKTTPRTDAQTNSSSVDWLCIEIEDTGAGIPEQDQAMLFERFRQGDHKRAGSGLGLYLSRRIVEAHRGTIEVRSEVGKGSLFAIRLPAC